MRILKNLDVAKASGIDQVSAKFLNAGAPVIATHLTNFINLSIKLDTFPSKSKIAKIKPLFKNGVKVETKIYRPNSILPLIPKVIENSIHDQKQHYLQRNELHFYQSDIRPNHFTDTSLSRLIL